jgi:hypothetical protein
MLMLNIDPARALFMIQIEIDKNPCKLERAPKSDEHCCRAGVLCGCADSHDTRISGLVKFAGRLSWLLGGRGSHDSRMKLLSSEGWVGCRDGSRKSSVWRSWQWGRLEGEEDLKNSRDAKIRVPFSDGFS